MRLTTWGARGSIPVSGRQYLKYGGDTTCVELDTDGGETLILDAGNGIRALGDKHLRLPGKGKTVHLLLTHAHWDHLLGFPFYKPLYDKGTTIRIHGCTNAQRCVRSFLQDTMRAPYFPVDLNEVGATLIFDDDCLTSFEIGDLHCQTFPLSHPNQGFGFRLTEAGRSMAFFPDNELTFAHEGGKTFDEYAEFVAGVDLLIHDAEYLPHEYQTFSRGWGHSVYLDTVRLAVRAGVGRLLLWHLNQERTDEQVDEMVRSARKAIDAAGAQVVCDAASAGMSFVV